MMGHTVAGLAPQRPWRWASFPQKDSSELSSSDREVRAQRGPDKATSQCGGIEDEVELSTGKICFSENEPKEVFLQIRQLLQFYHRSSHSLLLLLLTRTHWDHRTHLNYVHLGARGEGTGLQVLRLCISTKWASVTAFKWRFKCVIHDSFSYRSSTIVTKCRKQEGKTVAHSYFSLLLVFHHTGFIPKGAFARQYQR